MHNNIQNLFLEGLERFKGILIVTTNRKDLLDTAFSRRFTYKIQLPMPNTELRQKIWEIHTPKQLVNGTIDYTKLSELNLSGGEIRIVMEQAIRAAAFKNNSKIDNALLIELAKKEAVEDVTSKTKFYGFRI